MHNDGSVNRRLAETGRFAVRHLYSKPS